MECTVLSDINIDENSEVNLRLTSLEETSSVTPMELELFDVYVSESNLEGFIADIGEVEEEEEEEDDDEDEDDDEEDEEDDDEEDDDDDEEDDDDDEDDDEEDDDEDDDDEGE